MQGLTPSPLSVVAVGGGSGLAVLLRGLKHRFPVGSKRLAAVVTMSDDGGSSGVLRRELGVLPPGDIRNCIVALADDEALLARLFQYRFPLGNGLSGHSFGNLFLTALTGVTGDFYQAILTAESILSVRGRILPATVRDVRLRGRGESGTVYEGESAVGTSGERLVSLELEPGGVPAFPHAVDVLEDADLIVLGPGSLYTSILPNLMITGIREAIKRSRATVVLILNLMTQPGETDRMSAVDHLRAIVEHAGEQLVDVVLLNSTRPTSRLLRHYSESGSDLVGIDAEALAAFGIEVSERDLLEASDELIRHDPAKLAAAVLELAGRGKGR
jgi:uncharacterized cofD-like protein